MKKNVFGIIKHDKIDGYQAEYTTVGEREIKTKEKITDYKGERFAPKTEMCILRNDKQQIVEIYYNDPKHSYEFVPYDSRYGNVRSYVRGNDDGKIVENRDLGTTDEYISKPSETARISANEPLIVDTLITTRNEHGKEVYTFDPNTGAAKQYDREAEHLLWERLENGTQVSYKEDSHGRTYKYQEITADTETEFYPNGNKREVTEYDRQKKTSTSYFYDSEGSLAQITYEKDQNKLQLRKKGKDDEFVVVVNGKEISKENLELKQEVLKTLTGKYFGKTNPSTSDERKAKQTAETQAWASKILMKHFSNNRS